MVTVQSQSGLFIKKAEAREGKIRVRGTKGLFRKAAYSVLVDEGRGKTVMAGTLVQVVDMIMHRRLVKEAADLIEAVSQEVRDGDDLFSPARVSGGVSGTLLGVDIACLVAIKNGINEINEIAGVFGISRLKTHSRLMVLRRTGLVCREEGTILRYFLTSAGLETVSRGMNEGPFIQSKEWLSARTTLGKPQEEAPQKSY